eukprot:COSAG05_NODE_798_length_7245_cov_46.630982_9_plen_164_part_00
MLALAAVGLVLHNRALSPRAPGRGMGAVTTQAGPSALTLGRAVQGTVHRPFSRADSSAAYGPPGSVQNSTAPAQWDQTRKGNDANVGASWVTNSLDEYASLVQEEVEPVWRELDKAHLAARRYRGLPGLVDLFERRQSEFNMAITMLQLNVSNVCEVGMSSGV